MKLITKNIKVIFLILIVISLIIGLWYQNGNKKEFSQTEFLLNTQCNITAYGKDAKSAVNAAFSEVERIHSLTDFYSPSSDVSRINSAAADEAVIVDAALIDILTVALDVCEKSNGAFDITIAPFSSLWDFGGDAKTPPDEADILAAKAAVNFKNIVLDTKNLTVTKLNSETRLDLGGAAKGYAADRALAVLKTYNISGAIIDLGGNVSCFGKNPNISSKKWRIGVQIPFSSTGEYGEVITISSGSVVTSGTYQRNFRYEGKLYHHILNPANGYPSEQPYSSVTITASSALVADCLSTACFVLGEKDGLSLANQYGVQLLIQ